MEVVKEVELSTYDGEEHLVHQAREHNCYIKEKLEDLVIITMVVELTTFVFPTLQSIFKLVMWVVIHSCMVLSIKRPY